MIVSKIRIILWKYANAIVPMIYRKVYGVDIAKNVQISQHAFIDKNIDQQGVHIDAFTRIVR